MKPPSDAGRQPQLAQRTLEVIECVARLGPGTTAAELVAATRIPTATMYRIVRTLLADGYLLRVPDYSGFALGHRVVDMVHGPSTSRVLNRVREIGLRVEAGLGEGVLPVAIDSATAAIVDARDAQAPFDLTGLMHAHALGKLLLAFRRDLLHMVDLVPLTTHTTVDRRLLTAELDVIVEENLAYEREAAVLGQFAVAMAVRGLTGLLEGAIYVAVRTPEALVPTGRALQRIASVVPGDEAATRQLQEK